MEIFMWLLFVIIDWLVYFALHQGELKSSLYNIKLFRFNNSIWFTSGYGQDKKFWCDGVEHISLCSCRDGGTGTTWPKHSERWRNFWRCTLWSLWWLNLGALLVHTPDNCHFSHQNFAPNIFLHWQFYAYEFSSFVFKESQVCTGLFLKFSPHVCDNYQECLGLFFGFSFLNLWDVVEILGSLLGKMSVKILK